MPKPKKKKKKRARENPLIKDIIKKHSLEEIKSELLDTSDKLVKISLRLMNFDTLEFSLVLSENTPLFIIEQKIREHHGGSIEKLKFYKDQYNVKNKVNDKTKLLNQIFDYTKKAYQYLKVPKVSSEESSDSGSTDGKKREEEEEEEVEGEGDTNEEENKIEGSSPEDESQKKDEEEISFMCSLVYDYDQFVSDCPLLLSTPRLIDLFTDTELSDGSARARQRNMT